MKVISWFKKRVFASTFAIWLLVAILFGLPFLIGGPDGSVMRVYPFFLGMATLWAVVRLVSYRVVIQLGVDRRKILAELNRNDLTDINRLRNAMKIRLRSMNILAIGLLAMTAVTLLATLLTKGATGMPGAIIMFVSSVLFLAIIPSMADESEHTLHATCRLQAYRLKLVGNR